MNPKLSAIFARRSIRKYTEKAIPENILRDLLEAAMSAPSAVAKDPWEFIVLTDKTLMTSVAEALPNGKMLPSAAAGIIVCGDISKAHGNELSYLLQDCSAAIENILLAATMLNLGACWLGVHPRQERIEHIKKLFRLPDKIIPVSVIALGYPDEQKEPRTRFDSKKIHINSF